MIDDVLTNAVSVAVASGQHREDEYVDRLERELRLERRRRTTGHGNLAGE
jgi:hypothetical protein